MQAFWQDLFTTKIFYAPLVSWLMAQVIKTLIDFVPFVVIWLRGKKNEEQPEMFKDIAQSILWRTGGMPSSHSAMSSSLTTIIGFENGVDSPLFFVTFFFTTIVVRDAMGVRSFVGSLGHKYNDLVQRYNEEHNDNQIEEIKVVEGHTTSEVNFGVLLGFFVGLTVALF